MSIAVRIASTFLVMVVLIITSVSMGLYGNSRLSGILNYISGDAWNAANGAIETLLVVQEQVITLQELAIRPEQTRKAVDRINTLEQSIQNSVNLMLSSDMFGKSDAQQIEKLLQKFHNSMQSLVQALMLPESGLVLPSQQQFTTDARLLIQTLKKMRKTGTGNIETGKAIIESARDIAFNMLISVLALSLLLCVLNYWYIDRTITRPVNAAVDFMRNIADGNNDLTMRMDIRSNDEIGALSNAFNGFMRRIHQLIGEGVQQSTQVVEAVSQFSSVTAGTREKVIRQSMELEQVTKAVNQMAVTAGEIAQKASNASHNTDLASQHANKGKKVVAETSHSIKALAGEVTRAADVVAQLDQESQNIGAVLDVIKAIAEQTNLLALNAAIEAARAGEQGRGFAVVADEVRSLASRTQQSTQEIENMIEGLQEHARMATEAMKMGGSQAEEVVHNVNQASMALDEINQSVLVIVEMNTQIADAVEEQATVSGEISNNIINISRFTADIQNSAEQAKGAGTNLTDLVDQLAHIGQQFKL